MATGPGSRKTRRDDHGQDDGARSPNRRRTVAPMNDATVTSLIEQQTRPFLRAVKELKDYSDSMTQKIGNIVDRVSGLESQVMLLSERIRETARTQDQSGPRPGAVTSANGMKFLNEFEHAGRTNLKNRFRDKVKKFCLSRGGRMYFSSEHCKTLVTGKHRLIQIVDFMICLKPQPPEWLITLPNSKDQSGKL